DKSRVRDKLGRYGFCVTFRIQPSEDDRTLGVTQHPAQWSPDFPLRRVSKRSPGPPDSSIVTVARLHGPINDQGHS
ncbi:MAG: hypothetical protein ACE1ZD_00425, partial [Dehalococcoidia bacterium]